MLEPCAAEVKVTLTKVPLPFGPLLEARAKAPICTVPLMLSTTGFKGTTVLPVDPNQPPSAKEVNCRTAGLKLMVKP